MALLALAAIALLAGLWLDDGSAAWLRRKLAGFANGVLYSPLRSRVFDMILTADFLSVVALTVLLERLIPAHPRQKWLSANALQDARWFFYQAVLHAAIVATWVTLLVWFYRRYLASMPTPDFGALSTGMRFVIATVMVDLCMWLQHRVRYLLVTPQSHRIHHSIEPRHQNKNFGSLFRIWDFTFGTQYTKWDEYPETGIEDDEFPHETPQWRERATLIKPEATHGRHTAGPPHIPTCS